MRSSMRISSARYWISVLRVSPNFFCTSASFQDTRTFPGFAQVIFRPAYTYSMAQSNERYDQRLQVQRTSAASTQRHVVDTVRCLQLAVFIKLVDDHLGNRVFAQRHH